MAKETVENTEIVSTEMAQKNLPAVNETTDDFLTQEATKDDGIDYIPVIKTIQKGENSGKLFSEELAMVWDDITFCLVKITDSRVMWPEDYDEDNQPICRSHNGIVPACDIKEDPEDDNSTLLPGMSKKCGADNCPYAKWTKGKKGGSEAPRCKAIRDLLVLDLESNIPFYLSLSSTALTPFKSQLEKPLSFRKMALTATRSKAGLPPAHSCMFSFKIATDLRLSKKGDSYIPVFSDITELDDEVKEFTVQVSQQLQKFSIQNVRESSKVQDDNDGVAENKVNKDF